MGPPAPTPKRDASSAAVPSRTEAPCTRERKSNYSIHNHGHGHTSGELGVPLAAATHVEWASPTSIRARSRPSNLHSYLRSNAAYPLSAAASPRPQRRSGGSVSSSGSAGITSPKQSRSSRVRSQSTRATQTSTADFLITSEGDGSAAISLGVYGEIPRMGIDTVNYLIHALEERRHDLLQEEKAPMRASDASASSSLSEPQTEPNVFERAGSRPSTAKQYDGDVYSLARNNQGDEAPLTDAAIPRGRVRSRSYEALAKLEQILEARHQQLMQDGALDGPTVLPLDGPPGSDLTEEIRKLQQSFLMEARRQR